MSALDRGFQLDGEKMADRQMRLRLTTKICSLTKVNIEIQSEVEKDEP